MILVYIIITFNHFFVDDMVKNLEVFAGANSLRLFRNRN